MRTLDAYKGLDPVIMDVRGLCSYADYFLVCSGNSRRHVTALAQHLEEALAAARVKPLGVEGLQEGLWVLLDYGDVLIHIFSQPLREFYNLEGLWADAPRIFLETGAVSPPADLAPGPRPATPEESGQTRHE